MRLSRLPVAAITVAGLTLAPLALISPGSQAAPGDRARVPVPTSPELSETDRLEDRRSLVVGQRFYQMGAEDGRYPALGFHTRGEMGGFWSPPIKLLDGLWFGVGADPTWLTASEYTSGWGYQRMDLGTHDGVAITRTDFVPGAERAGLVGLHLASDAATTVELTVDAHSELMNVYPWGETEPVDQRSFNLPDSGAVRGSSLLFRDQGVPPHPNAEPHNYAAAVGSTLVPSTTDVGPGYRGPQDPATICPASGPDAPDQPAYCDDTEYGEGTGGRLTYEVEVPAGGTTVWFGVGGSDNGPREARAALASALDDPEAALAKVVRQRERLDGFSDVDIPADGLIEDSIAWSKQNLAKSVQEARDLEVRITNAGTRYPRPKGTVGKVSWLGAGWPDYPWLFATDGEYTAFASVASGQFSIIKKHIKALRDVSLVANGRSGKIVHEVTPDGQVFFGANSDPGNTDETAKFPSAVALIWRWTGDDRFRDRMYPTSKRAMEYIFRELDEDGDLWPEGLGNVEREGMGEEKLDNTVYTIRGLLDLADMARSKRDTETRKWAEKRALRMERRFDRAWWYGGDTDQYADSLDGARNRRIFQRHWIGVTPAEAELRMPDGTLRPLAPLRRARALVAKREEDCYSGEYGMYHTGTGPTSAEGGNQGPSCDSAVSSVVSERNVFTLNTSIIAVAEAAIGRMAESQVLRYVEDNAEVQLDPTVWEIPGDMPEISPSPDFGANIDKLFTERSSGLQAWGAYGVLWPVVRYMLGVSPDLGRDRLSVVSDVPESLGEMSADRVRLGGGSIDVAAANAAGQLRTTVSNDPRLRLTIGAVLPRGAEPAAVTLNGAPVDYDVVRTARGREVRVAAGRIAEADLVVQLLA